MNEKITYALLIYRTGPLEPTAQSSKRALEGHRTLQREASDGGDLRAVARLATIDHAKTVSGYLGAHDVMDGPYVETKEWLVGFYLLDCVNEAEALARARTICPVADHAIEVRPVTWSWKA